VSSERRIAVINPKSTRQLVRRWVAAHWTPIAFAVIVLVFLANAFIYFGFAEDDAGIVFRYAVNLAEGRGLVFQPGERVEAFSNFGYVILMSIAYRVLGLAGRPEVLLVVSKFVGLICSVAGLWLTYAIATRFIRLESQWTLFACLMVAASGPFAMWSVGGLETNIVLCVLLASLYLYLSYLERRLQSREGRNVVRAAFLCGVSLSVLTLLRADAFVFVAIIGAHWLFSRLRSREVCKADWPILVLPALTALSYEVWRLWYYGYPLPNSYYAKVQPVLSLALVVDTLQYYLEPYLHTLGGTGFVFGLAAICVYKDEKHASRFLAFVCATDIAYVLLVGGDWMAGYRFLVPVLPILLLLIVNGARYAVQGLSVEFAKTTAVTILSVCIAILLAAQQIHEGLGMMRRWRKNFWPWYAQPTFDVKEMVPYWDISTWLREHSDDSALVATHQAGFIPLLTGLRTIDTGGLANAALAHMPKDPEAFVWKKGRGRAGVVYRLLESPASSPQQTYILEQRPDLYVIFSRWNKEWTNTAQYLAAGEYVLLESNLYGFDIYVPTGGTDKVLVNVAAFGNASTSYSDDDPSGTSGNVFDGGTWTSGCNSEAWIQSIFDQPYVVERITVEVAGTDIITDDSLIEFLLLDPDDHFMTVGTLRETNVNWATASDGGALNSVSDYQLRLSEPVMAKGFRMNLKGHGWFVAKDVRVLGRE